MGLNAAETPKSSWRFTKPQGSMSEDSHIMGGFSRIGSGTQPMYSLPIPKSPEDLLCKSYWTENWASLSSTHSHHCKFSLKRLSELVSCVELPSRRSSNTFWLGYWIHFLLCKISRTSLNNLLPVTNHMLSSAFSCGVTDASSRG